MDFVLSLLLPRHITLCKIVPSPSPHYKVWAQTLTDNTLDDSVRETWTRSKIFYRLRHQGRPWRGGECHRISSLLFRLKTLETQLSKPTNGRFIVTFSSRCPDIRQCHTRDRVWTSEDPRLSESVTLFDLRRTRDSEHSRFST